MNVIRVYIHQVEVNRDPAWQAEAVAHSPAASAVSLDTRPIPGDHIVDSAGVDWIVKRVSHTPRPHPPPYPDEPWRDVRYFVHAHVSYNGRPDPDILPAAQAARTES